MKKKLLITIMLIVVLLSQTIVPVFAMQGSENVNNEITITDSNLYVALKEIIGENATYLDEENKIMISESNLQRITYLDLNTKNISDLTGIGAFKYLETLNLSANQISEDSNLKELNSLEKLNVLNLSSNDIADTSEITLNINEGIDYTSQTISKVEFVDIVNTAEEATSTEGKTILLPNVLNKAKETGADLKVYTIDSYGDLQEVKKGEYQIISSDEGLKVVVSKKSNGQNILDEGKNKIVIEVVDSEGSQTDKYNKTKLYLTYIAFDQEELEGISFEDEKLYNAIKEDLTSKEYNGLETNGTNIAGKQYAKYNSDNKIIIDESLILPYGMEQSDNTTIDNNEANIFFYDSDLIIIIKKSALLKDITRLTLDSEVISNLKGIEKFVALSELYLDNNNITDIKEINELHSNKASKEKELQEKVLKLLDNAEEENLGLSQLIAKKQTIDSEIAKYKSEIETKTETLDKMSSEEANRVDENTGKTRWETIVEEIDEIQDELLPEKEAELKEQVNLIQDKIKAINEYVEVEEIIEFKLIKNYIEEFNEYINEKVDRENGDITSIYYMSISDLTALSEIITKIKTVLNNNIENLTIDEIDVLNNSDSEFGLSEEEQIVMKSKAIISQIRLAIKSIDSKATAKRIITELDNYAETTETENETISSDDVKIDELTNIINSQLNRISSKEETLKSAYRKLKEIYTTNLKKTLSEVKEKQLIEDYMTIEINKKVTNIVDETLKNLVTEDLMKLYGEALNNAILEKAKTIDELKEKLEIFTKLNSDNNNIITNETNGVLNVKLDEISDVEKHDAACIKLEKVANRLIAIKESLQELVILPKLEKLDLSYNMIRDITDLKDITTLKILALTKNLITDISTVDWTKFEELLGVSFARNRIKEVLLSNIPKLQVLNLADNLLTTTDGVDVESFAKLNYLDLSCNQISNMKNLLDRLNNHIYNGNCEEETIYDAIKNEKYTLNLKAQSITAEAKYVQQGNQEVEISLPKIFEEAKEFEYEDVSFGILSVSGSVANDGKTAQVSTRRLGDNVAMVTIEGGIASGTQYTLTYKVISEEEAKEIPATGIQIQLEKTLTDDENAARPDFNDDGKVNSEDLEIFNKYWLGSITIAEEKENLAKNIVPDENLTKEDHLLLVKYVQNGWDDSVLTDEQRQKAEEADITGDNEVTNDDFIVLSNYLIGGIYSPYTEEQIIAEFDINGDGKVNAVDVINMSRYLTSKSTEKINIDTLTLEMLNDYKQSKQLYAELLPENTTQKDVEWISHDERIVKVDSNGKVTAVGTGTTGITVKSTKNANIYDTISVTVKVAADIVTNIKLKDESSLAKEYYVGQDLNLEGAKAIITRRSGKETEIDITKEMVKGFDTTVATTEPKIVTVEYTDEFETTVQTTFNITVAEFTGEDVVTEIKLVPPAKLEYNKGEKLDLTGATVEKIMDSGIKQEEVNVTADMISGYDMTKPGEQTVTVTYEGKTATFNVMVNNPVTGVNLNKTEYTIVKGGETHLVATVMPQDAINKNVTWTTSDENIATVDDAGKVTAVGIGEAIITVTTKEGEKSTTCKIIVKEQVYTAKELESGTIAITGINPNTTEEYFRDKFITENTYKIFKNNGTTEISSADTIATGYVLKVYDANETVVEEQVLVVKGDIDGDGKASATDSGAILAHRTGKTLLENEYLLAADINNDGVANSTDSILLIYHRIGMAGYILQNN